MRSREGVDHVAGKTARSHSPETKTCHLWRAMMVIPRLSVVILEVHSKRVFKLWQAKNSLLKGPGLCLVLESRLQSVGLSTSGHGEKASLHCNANSVLIYMLKCTGGRISVLLHVDHPAPSAAGQIDCQ
jgi:hypothetical protein